MQNLRAQVLRAQVTHAKHARHRGRDLLDPGEILRTGRAPEQKAGVLAEKPYRVRGNDRRHDNCGDRIGERAVPGDEQDRDECGEQAEQGHPP